MREKGLDVFDIDAARDPQAVHRDILSCAWSLIYH